jgi:transposase InsO family protein
MTINMDISHITTVPQIINFLNETKNQKIASQSDKAKIYGWISRILSKNKYHSLPKKQKRIIKLFLKKVTGYSAVQIKRLIAKHKQGQLHWIKWQKSSFCQIYSREDIALLHNVDEIHRLSGPATKKILQREYTVFGNEKYGNLSNISVPHIYNLRKSKTYIRHGKFFQKTKPNNIPIGKRQKPRPCGKPGYFRVDTVHQGDKDKKKGVYFINIVDEVTQMEFVFCVPAISAKYIKRVLEDLIKICPIKIFNFHSDNGSEYINQVIADLLNKAHIGQTKSRPRKHNDNALVESKNGSIIRKHFGYAHIPATERNAQLLNTFCVKWLNSYLNYHRPCGFATIKIDRRGKEKKVYKVYQTPYEKFKSLKNAKYYLKKGLSLDQLDEIANFQSDTEFARQMNNHKDIFFSYLKF